MPLRCEMLNHRVLFAVIGLVLFLASVSGYGAEKKRASTVAVLDLQSPEDSPWLGAAIAESLAARLGGVEQIRLVERENVPLLLSASASGEIKPALLGADYVVTGSVQLAGAWNDEASTIRISVKLIAAESATIQGKAALVQDGKLSDLFTIETTLAETLAKAMSKEASLSALGYCEERNLRARKLFGEGLALLRKAAALPGTASVLQEKDLLAASEEKEGATGTPEEESASGALLRDDVRAQASELLNKAITAFRTAQTENMGDYFSRAHAYEGRAREWLARVQADAAKAKDVRDATVAQFRQDAADAAPAFFNLGRALQENSQYEDAIQAYDQYLQWMSEENKYIKWELTNLLQFDCPKISGAFPEWFGHRCGFYAEDRLFTLEKTKKNTAEIVCRDPLSAMEIWRIKKLNDATIPDSYSLCMAAANGVLCVLQNFMLHVFDATTGKHSWSVQLPYRFDFPTGMNVSQEHRIDIQLPGDPYLVTSSQGYVELPEGKKYSAFYAVIDIENKRVYRWSDLSDGIAAVQSTSDILAWNGFWQIPE